MGCKRENTGAILILTLWVTALLSLMATGVLLHARLGVREAKWADIELQATLLVKAAATLAVDRLAEDDDLHVDSYKEAWGRPYTTDSTDLISQYPGRRMPPDAFELEIKAVDEAGKININFATEEFLVAVLREYGAESQAPDIARAIMDWRDEDGVGPFEREFYQRLNPPYAPSDADFKTIDELLFVHGVDPHLFFGEDANRNQRLDPNEDDGDTYWPPDNMDGRLQLGLIEAFTVYGEGDININTVPPQILRIVLKLVLDDETLAETLADRILAKRQGQDRIDGTDVDAPFESRDDLAAFIGQHTGGDTTNLALRAASPFIVTSNAFRFYIRVRFPEKHYTRTAELVVMREDGHLTVLEYHDGE